MNNNSNQDLNQDSNQDLKIKDSDLRNILIKMYDLSEKAFFNGEAPISAILFDRNKSEIKYCFENKHNESKKNHSNNFHAEYLLINELSKKIEKDKKDFSKEYSFVLFVTCLPCSKCVFKINKFIEEYNNKFPNNKFPNNKFDIRYLTSFGKEEELENGKNFYKNNKVQELKLKSELQKIKLIACKRWIDYKFLSIFKNINNKEFKYKLEDQFLKSAIETIKEEVEKLNNEFKENKLIKEKYENKLLEINKLSEK